MDILFKPHTDLYPVGILINNGEFKGSGLDKITNKSHSGAAIPDWYNNKEYSKIESYIQQKSNEFVNFASCLSSIMPTLRSEF